ncbi:hypothetical protein OIU79_002599 [Salix purpurea]|uniref:Uncharacterized protein n=1 Tax=Salix purpurea TaxID=77065 RepID=A0A9Q0ZEC7_SALPP|nr:hypothetical protein OIU79_002599 [Salix purpurea]
MDENSGSMLIGSCQIVRLKEKSPKVAICNSWPKRNQPSLGSTPCGIPPDDVGPELRSYLSHSLFKVLLEKVEEEFGLDHTAEDALTFEE